MSDPNRRAADLNKTLPGTALVRWLGPIAAVFLFAMMIVTVIDVVGRYLFARPLPGAFELTEIMMAVLIFSALPLISARDGHIAVGLLDHLTGPRLAQLRDVVIAVLGGVVTATISVRLWILGDRLRSYGDVFEFVGLAKYVVAYTLSVLAMVTALVMVAKLRRAIRALWTAPKDA